MLGFFYFLCVYVHFCCVIHLFFSGGHIREVERATLLLSAYETIRRINKRTLYKLQPKKESRKKGGKRKKKSKPVATVCVFTKMKFSFGFWMCIVVKYFCGWSSVLIIWFVRFDFMVPHPNYACWLYALRCFFFKCLCMYAVCSYDFFFHYFSLHCPETFFVNRIQ